MSFFSRRAAWIVAAPVVLYACAIMLSTTAFIQRHILYCHKLYQWWEDSDQPQNWGFARNQVTSFHLDTEDGEKIHAWHIMPLPLYRKHEALLQAQPTGHCDDVVESASFRLLRDDPAAKLIVYLHGNAGHITSLVRATSFHTYTATSDYHVLAIDYRGFGSSTGTPGEDGLILDASAALHFALNVAGLSPDRIVVLGHSLGSAVAVGAAERYARVHGVDFAGVLLVAGFSSLPNMLASYAVGGLVPLLRPVRNHPRILHFILGSIQDRWETARRLRSMVNMVLRANQEAAAADGSSSSSSSSSGTPRRHLRLGLIHAANDRDIPCHESDAIFAAVVGALLPKKQGKGATADEIQARKEERTRHLSENEFVSEWRDRDVAVRQEQYPYGGHNNIVLSPPVLLEIMRALEEAETRQ